MRTLIKWLRDTILGILVTLLLNLWVQRMARVPRLSRLQIISWNETEVVVLYFFFSKTQWQKIANVLKLSSFSSSSSVDIENRKQFQWTYHLSTPNKSAKIFLKVPLLRIHPLVYSNCRHVWQQPFNRTSSFSESQVKLTCLSPSRYWTSLGITVSHIPTKFGSRIGDSVFSSFRTWSPRHPPGRGRPAMTWEKRLQKRWHKAQVNGLCFKIPFV